MNKHRISLEAQALSFDNSSQLEKKIREKLMELKIHLDIKKLDVISKGRVLIRKELP